MEISAKELRGKPGQIIEQAARGTEIVITIRGKKVARLIPYASQSSKKGKSEVEDGIFGLWKDRKDQPSVEAFVRSMREGRTF